MLANPFPYLVVLNELVPALEQGKHVEVLGLVNNLEHFVDDIIVP